MKKEAIALAYRAIINHMAGNKEKAQRQYEEFLKHRHLYVSIFERIKIKGMSGMGNVRNKTRVKIEHITKLIGTKFLIEVKTVCPWCGKLALLLKEKGSHYWCMNCEREGSLDELESYLYKRLMEEKRAVERVL